VKREAIFLKNLRRKIRRKTGERNSRRSIRGIMAAIRHSLNIQHKIRNSSEPLKKKIEKINQHTKTSQPPLSLLWNRP
jgi:hypothetical protein